MQAAAAAARRQGETSLSRDRNRRSTAPLARSAETSGVASFHRLPSTGQGRFASRACCGRSLFHVMFGPLRSSSR
eukprot:15451947-Alexandrium_andersonii.AAC.1